MKIKEFLKQIPLFPLSVFIFYLTIVFLWSFNAIPSPNELISLVKEVYKQFGLAGLFVIGIIEGLAYFGLYFPGNSIIALFFIFSDGKFLTLLIMILIVTLALTTSSILNYWGGRIFAKKRINKKLSQNYKKVEKGLFFSVLHPDLLAFYFFYRGIKKKNFWKFLYVPLLLIPYGLILAFFLSIFSSFIKEKIIGNPLITLLGISIWFILAFIFRHKENFLRGSHRIYKSLFS